MPSALIVTDMLSPYDFDDAEKLAESARDVVPNIKHLVERAREGDVPVIYVNDAHGDRQPSPQSIADRALKGERPELIEPILPPDDAIFVPKVRHSIFYGTPLEYLLHRLEVDRIVITGQVTEQCVLYSTLDAYVRELEVAVPRDAVAHIHQDLAEAALTMMERNMHADVGPAGECDL